MPELPEVETVRRTLTAKVTGQRITGVEVLSTRAVRPWAPEEFAAALTGETIVSVSRRGKYLEFHLSSGGLLLVHLRMTGRLLAVPGGYPRTKHTAVVLGFASGHELHFVDQRKFGVMELVSSDSEASLGYRTLGPETLDADFTVSYLQEILTGRTGKIKALLLDQRLIAGLGNIYADEALFRAGIHPERTGGSLSDQELERLHRAICQVLEEGICHRGTTIRNYVDGEGIVGEFQHHLRVYGREGEPCVVCGTPICRLKVGGRSSYHCPQCQK